MKRTVAIQNQSEKKFKINNTKSQSKTSSKYLKSVKTDKEKTTEFHENVVKLKRVYKPQEFLEKVHQRLLDEDLLNKAKATSKTLELECSGQTAKTLTKNDTEKVDTIDEDDENNTERKAKADTNKEVENNGWVFLKRDRNLAVLKGDLVVLDPEALGEMFIWVGDSDVLDAIAYCVAQSIISMPRVRQLPPDQLKVMVDTAFFSIKQKCLKEKIWDWGKFMYNVYGWGNMAYSVMTQPAVVCAIVETVVSVLLLLGF
jgi:hypothetical protein